MLLCMSRTKANTAALKQLSSCVFRIIRNEAGNEKEELTGYELAGALGLTEEKPMWKNYFLRSHAVSL